MKKNKQGATVELITSEVLSKPSTKTKKKADKILATKDVVEKQITKPKAKEPKAKKAKEIRIEKPKSEKSKKINNTKSDNKPEVIVLNEIWESIKNRELGLFGLSGQTISKYCEPLNIDPNRCLLKYKVSSVIPAVEHVVSDFNFETIGAYLSISKKV